jgi:hypothetical protein
MWVLGVLQLGGRRITEVKHMTELIDYAAPMMRIETLLKDMHNLLLDNKFDQAIELSPVITAEAKLLQHTLILMKENRR